MVRNTKNNKLPLTYRCMQIIMLWLTAVECEAQTNGIVFDAESRRPVQGVKIYINPRGMVLTDRNGRFHIPQKCNSVTMTHLNYVSRSLNSEELKDTIWLLPRLHRLDEVVITAKGPKVGFNIDETVRKNSMQGAAKAPSGLGFDFFSLFKKHKSKKKQKRIDKILKDY